MWKYNQTDELYHYGILGMRWGHRKKSTKVTKQHRKAIKRKLRKNKLTKAGLTTLQGANALAGGYSAYTAAKAIKNKRYGKALVRSAFAALAVSNIRDAQKLKNDYTPKIKKEKEKLKKLKYK